MARFELRREQHAERAVEENLAADECDFRIVFVGEIAVDGLRRTGQEAFRLIERVARNHAHRANAAFGHLGSRRLHDFDARNELHGQIAKIHIAAATDGQRQGGNAIELDTDQRLVGAANADAAAFTILPIDLYAGNALDRFADILVGEVTDVFGGNRIHHLDRFALDRERVAHRCANAA